jgi:hypothetical protein
MHCHFNSTFKSTPIVLKPGSAKDDEKTRQGIGPEKLGRHG